jgi:hypothetical protein
MSQSEQHQQVSNRMKRLSNRIERLRNRMKRLSSGRVNTLMKRKNQLEHNQKLPLINDSQGRR